MTTHIAFVLPSLLGGGAEFVTREWAAELSRRGHTVDIVLLRAETQEPEVADGVRVLSACAAGSGRRAENRALLNYLRSTRATLAISMMTRANFQLILMRARLTGSPMKIAISERNIPYVEADQSRLHVWLRQLAYRALYRRADLFIAISHATGSVFSYASGLASNRVWVVPNPALGKVRSQAIRERAAATGLHLVVPGRLVDKKRPLLAVAIADAVNAIHPVDSLTFFGTGPLREILSELQRPYEIHLPGRIDLWFEHLPAGTVCLLPSAVEGFGNVLIEAASQGVPCVVGSTAFGSSDAIIPGVSGVFARTDSIEEYARSVLEAHAMSPSSPAAWLDTFSLQHSINVLERAIDSTIADTSSRPPAVRDRKSG